MSIYEKTNVARALLYWAKNNNGNEAYYLEDRMYAIADNGMVILLTADSYDEAIRKAKARHTQGEWVKVKEERMSVDMSGEIVTRYKCSKCGRVIATFPNKLADYYPFCHCGADMRKGGAE